MKILYDPNVEEYLIELSQILYDKEYFGFIEDAKQYVRDIIFEINLSLDKKIKKEAPEYFNRYGEGLYYTAYKKNKNTSWYVFFHYEDEIYLIRFIGNNHNVGKFL